MTGIVEITRNGAKASRGLISIQSRLNQITDESSSTGEKLTNWYKQHNIAIYDQEGQLRSLYDIAGDVAQIWDDLSKNEKLYYLNTQAGANQTQNLAALLENYDQVLNAHQLALDSAGSATRENAAYMDSFEAKINNLKATLQELALKIINSDLIKALIDFGTKLVQVAGSDMGAFLVKVVAVTAAVNGLRKAFEGFKTLFIFNTLAEGAAAVTTAATAGTSAVGGLTVAFASLAGPLGIILGLTTAIIGAFALYKKYQAAPSEKLEKDKKTLEDTKNKYKEITDEYKTLLARQEDLVRQGKDLNDAEKKRLELLKKQTKELEQQEKQQMANVASSTVGALSYTQTGTKTIRKGQEFAVVPTEEVIKGQKAFEAMAQAIAEATEQYEKGQITLSDYNSRTGELNDQLDTVYDSYLEVIRSGGELNEQDQLNYATLIDLKVAWVKAQGASSNYAQALNQITPNTEEAIHITDLYGESLELVGNKYYFVTEAAKKAAIEQLNTEMQTTKGVLEQIQTKIAARALEYESIAEFNKEALKYASPSAAEKFYSSEQGQAVQRYYKLKENLEALKKIQVKGTGLTDTGGGSSDKDKKGSSKETSQKARELLEKYKKELEEYQKVQEDAYKKGEISASKYYSNIQKKGKALWQDLKKRGKDYADSAQSMFDAYVSANSNSVKEIFSELDYRYKESDFTGKQYYNNLWKYANKFYKNGKLSFDEYRDYVSKGYDALFDELENNYNDGKITAQQYQEQVKKAQENANKAIQNATKKGLIDKSVAGEVYNLLVKRGAEAANSVAKALHDSMVKAAKQAVAEAEAELERAQKRQTQAETYISALQFWSDEERERIDKVIDGYNDEIDKLQEQLDLLDKQNDELDKQAERVKLVNALEDAKKKKVRIYDERYGWIWGEDKKAVSEAQTALDEFDKEQARKKERDAINAEIKALEELIKKKEAEKKAYQDVIDEQTKALNRYNIESQLGATIEEAIFQDRIENFDNWKNSYINGISEVISAIEAVNNAQSRLDFAQSELDRIEAEEVPEIKTGKTSTTGATYEYTDDMSKQEKRNAAVRANINQRKAQGYTVTEWYDDKGNLHYKATLPKKNKRATGDVSIPKSGVYNVNELGDELIVPPKGNFDYLKKGTGVVPANLTKNLMDWGKFNPKSLLGKQSSSITNDHSITIQNLTVQSDNAKDFVRQLQNLAIVKQ